MLRKAAIIIMILGASIARAATPEEDIFSAVGCTGADCDFDDLINLVSVVIDFIVFVIIAPFAAVMFAVAGWKMMTAGDNVQQVSEAKTIFKYVGIGLIFAVGAWLLVSALLDGLGVGLGDDADINLLD